MPVASRSSSRAGAGRRAPRPTVAAPTSIDAPPANALLTLVWDSPFPASLQDAAFRFVDVNPAFAALVGVPREALIGTDFVDLQFEEDAAVTLESRKRFVAAKGQVGRAYVPDGRLRHSDGQERWFRAARHVVEGDDGEPLFLAVLQDTTSEHAARERADRSVRELDDWFDLSPFGMVLFDDSGLLVRSNPAFDAMAGGVPVALGESAPSLARLLAWGDGGRLQQLQPGSRPIETEGWVTRPDGQMRRLRAIVRCYRTAGGQRRFMGIVEDRSVEEERDLAQMQIGALMDTAGVGIATFQESSGWVLQRPADGGHPSAMVPHLTGRDRVAADSLAEYDRLQRALQHNERAEARYAIEHPELGRRWLFTRVEPATLASGKKTASVVTQDITDQQRNQRRSEQLLREMTTILESATAGIAYLRDGRLVRCNRRFEVMLRLPSDGSVGAGLAELLARHPRSAAMAADSSAALAADALYETEFAFGGDAGETPSDPGAHDAMADEGELRWYSLSVRRAGGSAETDEAIAVLSDVTRMKTQQVQLESLATERESMASRTRAILDSVLVGIVTVGAGGIEWMNRSAQRMFAGSLQEFVGLPMSVVATPEPDHPFLAPDVSVELADGRTRTFECRVRGRDGRTFWIVGNAFETSDAGGARQLTFALLDIERRRQAEAAVFEAQASLRRVIEAAPLAIALLDARTLTVVQVNDVAARTVDELPEDLLGTTPEAIFGAELGAVRRADMEHALGTSGLTRREYRYEHEGETRIWDARYLPLAADAGAVPDQLLLVATDVTEQRAAEDARLEAAIAQRDMLVKEVHHRIKNNLQGVAGLLQQIAQRKPEVAAAIDEVVGQVQAIAQVHGLQVGATGPLSVVSILAAITSSVQRTFGRPIRCEVAAPDAAGWVLPEVESIPIALTINELLTNAVKHSAGSDSIDDIVCALECDAGGVRVSISNTAVLAKGFSLARIPNGVSGLGLVRALLPRRSATLRIGQFGAQVMATVTLRPPVVARTVGA